MTDLGLLGEELRDLARPLSRLDRDLGAVRQTLRGLAPDDVGPADAATALAEALTRLDRRLAALAVEAGDAAAVVLGHAGGSPVDGAADGAADGVADGAADGLAEGAAR